LIECEEPVGLLPVFSAGRLGYKKAYHRKKYLGWEGCGTSARRISNRWAMIKSFWSRFYGAI